MVNEQVREAVVHLVLPRGTTLELLEDIAFNCESRGLEEDAKLLRAMADRLDNLPNAIDEALKRAYRCGFGGDGWVDAENAAVHALTEKASNG